MVHVRIVSEPWSGLSFLGQIFNQLPNVTQVDTIVAGLVAKDLRHKATEAYHRSAVQNILEDNSLVFITIVDREARAPVFAWISHARSLKKKSQSIINSGFFCSEIMSPPGIKFFKKDKLNIF